VLHIRVDLASLDKEIGVVRLFFQSQIHVVQGLFVILLQSMRLAYAAENAGT